MGFLVRRGNEEGYVGKGLGETCGLGTEKGKRRGGWTVGKRRGNAEGMVKEEGK